MAKRTPETKRAIEAIRAELADAGEPAGVEDAISLAVQTLARPDTRVMSETQIAHFALSYAAAVLSHELGVAHAAHPQADGTVRFEPVEPTAAH